MKLLSFVLSCSLLTIFSIPADAEVRHGETVRIGGHDFANQSYNGKRNADIYLYEGRLRKEDCSWQRGKNSERVKVCHLSSDIQA